MAVNQSKKRDPRFWRKWRESGAVGPFRMTIVVWNEFQRTPASLYGDSCYGEGQYQIIVSNQPAELLNQLGKKRATIYHFSS